MMMRTLLAVVPALTLAACGMGAPTPDVAAYQKTVSELQATVTTHQTDAAATAASDCAAEHLRYDDAMRSRLQQMTGMSGGMDSCLRAMGHAGPFDMHSMCGSMQSELDRHATAACTGDAAANHAEAAHHCQLMMGWLSQEQSRTDSMTSMGGMMGGGRCTP